MDCTPVPITYGGSGSGAHPWHLDNETDSILFLTNMGDRQARIGFHAQANGVHYFLTRLNLNPHEKRAIFCPKNGEHYTGPNDLPPFSVTNPTVSSSIRDLHLPQAHKLAIIRAFTFEPSVETCGEDILNRQIRRGDRHFSEEHPGSSSGRATF